MCLLPLDFEQQLQQCLDAEDIPGTNQHMLELYHDYNKNYIKALFEYNKYGIKAREIINFRRRYPQKPFVWLFLFDEKTIKGMCKSVIKL